MDYSEFKRESLVRHQAEKLLDRNIIGFERVLVNYYLEYKMTRGKLLTTMKKS